jgi:hypothetical protein
MAAAQCRNDLRLDDGPMTQATLRYGVVALARSDRRLMEATLRSIARLRDGPDAVAMVVSRQRAHAFADASSNPEFPSGMRVATSDYVDALPLGDGFRAMVGEADVILFVPESVVLDPDYLTAIRETATRWHDMVGELDVIRRIVDDPSAAPKLFAAVTPQSRPGLGLPLGLPLGLRARTLCANVLWVRVAACGNLKFTAFPQSSEYLAFSSVLDQLRPRGRTRLVTSDQAMQLRPGPERRSGFEAGRELYGSLNLIGDRRARSDMAFENRPSYLDPQTEKLRLLGEQFVGFFGASARRAHIGSFIRGMWAARREAHESRHRIRQDIRKLR